MESQIVDLILGSAWPFVAFVASVLAFIVAIKLQNRYVMHKERCLQLQSKPQPPSQPHEGKNEECKSEKSDHSGQPNSDHLAAEYSALISYHNSIVTHRFTLLGFFLATVAFLAKDGMQIQTAFLLLIITLSLYIVERRNQVLYTQMSKRAMQIERIHWGLIKPNEEKKIAELPLFCRFRPNELPDELKKDLTDELKKELDSLNSIWRLIASHSWGLNLLYAAVGIYAILCIIGVIPQKVGVNK